MRLSKLLTGLALHGAGALKIEDRVDELAEAVAGGLREVGGVAPDDPLDDGALDRILRFLGCSMQRADELRSDLGGPEAMLVRRAPGDYCILVDPRPAGGWKATGSEQEASARRRIKFRVLHEAGHTFFYAPPETSAADGATAISSEAEESFCDRLAAATLLPPAIIRMASPDADTAYDLSTRFDVSAHLVARSFAQHHAAVSSVSLIIHGEHGPRVQWSTGAVAAQEAVEECARADRSRANVHWAMRGPQSLRVECVRSAAS